MAEKKRKLGKQIDTLEVGDYYTATRVIEDRDLLLYLGLTDDANPLYLQHDYASETPYQQPIVPVVMLFGMAASIVSMHLPGPGSHITRHEMSFPKPVYHYTEITFNLEIIAVDRDAHQATMSVIAYDNDGDEVVHGKLNVIPSYEPESISGRSLKNFF
ncbi:MaoC/PaaZ C-terminal domain-containing protein [Virgibacillus siamensis]|uniref:MaoC/PaaZ C-terminal domain-containing protein n=1 Tax=Virgibacillus siamensis TaxID=480071 RepID=UPI001588F86E|nr:MaoC/PaaZ C-terminal domain-containing protein [Virgibacillus siamensis]